MSGVKIVQNPHSSNIQELILTNSVHLDFGDFVTIDSSGFLNRSAAGDKIMGVYAGYSVDATSDNQTVAQVKGKYQPVDDDTVFELVADQACTQTDVGAYADIALSTNAILCNLNSGATGQLLVIDFDPERDGSTTIVRVKVAEPQTFAFAQS